MFRLSLPALILSAATAAAQGFVTDAFGILPADAVTPARAAWAGAQTAPPGARQIHAEDPDAMLLFIGPKSIVAGKEDGHAVTLAFDRHGNLVTDGQHARFTLGPRQWQNRPTRDGIGDVLFRPAPRAGTFVGGASLAGRQSPRATYRVTADLNSVTPQMMPVPAPARFETLIGLSTQPMADRFGNAVDDGIGAGLMIGHADGRISQLASIVRDGRARAMLLSRDIAATGTARAHLGTHRSPGQPLVLSALRADGPTGLKLWALRDLDAVALRVGPVTTTAGHLLNDGAPVTVHVSNAAGRSDAHEGWIRDGHFDTALTLSPDDGPFVVRLKTANGHETREIGLSDAPRNQTIRGAE